MKRTCSLVLTLLLVMTSLFTAPVFAADGDVVLTIKGDGVAKEMTFTMADLEKDASAIAKEAYTTTNNWPTDKTVYAEGVRLDSLLAQAGIKDEATLIKVTSSDGYNKTFTRQELLDADRYSYGDSSAGKKVPAILAFRNSEKSFADMSKAELTLTMGQRVKGEQTNPWFVKKTATIEVTTEAVEQWPEVTFSRSAATGGVSLEMKHDSMDNIKVYYTTDGTDPTVNSTVYNISTSYWQPELIKPILISKDTEIRAIAIGPGKADSKISTTKITFGENGTVDPEENQGSDTPAAFSDLGNYVWAKTAIESLAAKGVVNGKPGGVYAPQDSLRRCEFAKMIVLSLGQEPATGGASSFSDVKAADWHYGYVAKAAELGLIKGYTDGTFRPDNTLTKEEMLTIAVRAMKKEAEAQAIAKDSPLLTPFASETRISAWALNYVALAESLGLLEHGHMAMEQKDGSQTKLTFDGKGTANRAEAAYVMYQMIESLQEK